MSNTKHKNIKKESADIDNKQLIIHQISQTNVDRTPKDVADYVLSVKVAENIHYPNRSKLLDIYKIVELDGHFTGIWAKRRSASTNKTIFFQDKAGKKVDELDTLINSREFRKLKKHIVDSVAWGLSGAQFIPGAKFQWEEIPRKHILIEKEQIKINQNDHEGFPYQEDPFIMVYGDKDNYGLMKHICFYAIIKKGNFADWAQYSEIFGQPVRVIKYDAWDDKTRIQLKQILDESGSSLALMIPKQTDFEIMDGKTSNGNGDLQDKLKVACNNEMSIAILGNTETSTSENGGSEAKAKIQDEGEDDLKADDLMDMLSYLNDAKFLDILESYGYPVQGGQFCIQEKAEPYKAQAIVNTIIQVKSSGTPVSDDYIYEATGIPKPENYDQLKKEIQTSFKPSLQPAQQKKQIEEDVEDLSDSFINKIRLKLANFFDLAQ